jgi:hypothetical protein
LEFFVNDQNQICNAPPALRRRRSYCWLPVALLEPGMVLAKPLSRGMGRVATILLAAGSRITSSTIAQIINKGIESVAVQTSVRLNEEDYVASIAQYEERLHQIFGDSPDDDCAGLLAALIAEGPDAD